MFWGIYNEKLVRKGETFVEQYNLGDWSKDILRVRIQVPFRSLR